MNRSVTRAGRLVAGAVVLVASTGVASTAAAQVPSASSSPIGMLALLAMLALAPFLLTMVTSFAKIAIVLSLLRSAIGVQQVPPNQVITGLAIVLSIYIMAPVGYEIWHEVEPYVEQMERDEFDDSFSGYVEVASTAAEPLRSFLLKHSSEEDRTMMLELALELRAPEQREGLESESLLVVIPAFVLTELAEAFTIGFILFVPFIVVDLVVANILLSLGMHMLSPTTISLPFKLLLFVLVDGWYLVIRGLVLGYA